MHKVKGKRKKAKSAFTFPFTFFLLPFTFQGMGLLQISDGEIRRHGPGSVFAACWRQWRAERQLARRGIHFRGSDLDKISVAYAAMSDREFDAINARQNWANWRTIPRALSGHVPDRPLCVIDLGCGTGSSTRVLAFYCPAGSRIVGYELVRPLIDCARRRHYHQRDGRPADVSFMCQPVTDPLRQENSIVADASVDLANASGVVGHHLDASTVLPLVLELKRIIVPNGIAMLDVGPSLPMASLVRIMTGHGFTALGRYKSWFLDPTGQVVFRR